MMGIDRQRRFCAVVGSVAIVLGACSGSSTPSPAPLTATPLPAATTPATPAPTTAGTAEASPTAATGPTPGNSPSPSPAGTPVAYSGPTATIEYSIWGDPVELKNQKAIVDAFHAAEPKITVKVTVADWDTYWDKLLTSLTGNAAPDVFAMDGPLFPDYAGRDVLLDLTPYIEREGYDTSSLDASAVKDFRLADGRQLGLPRDLNVIALFYNKKLFDAAGVAYPDDSWDWTKLVEVAHKLTLDANADGKPEQWGLYTETTDMENYWSSLVWQNGGEIIAPDGAAIALDSDVAAGGIQFLQDLIWKEKVVPDPALFVETGDAFEQGKAAMEANGSWLVATDETAGLDFGIAPLPKGPAGRATSINPTGAVVSKATKSPDAAWAFVKFLAGVQAQEKIMALKASLPANRAVLEGPFPNAYPDAKVFVDALGYAHLKPSFKGYNEFTTILQAELDEHVFNAPDETARQAIDKVKDQLNGILAGT